MKKITIITFLMALFCLTTQAQSVKLNAQIKTQRLFLSKDKVNLAASDFATVAVAANCDYTATADQDWLTIRKTANGNTALFPQTNYDLAYREGTVTFTTADGTIKRTLKVRQDGYDATDELIPVASGKASQSQSGEGIERSFDGNFNTLYHSPYSGTTFPVTLTYNLQQPSHVDYALYTPRQDGNSNGNFNDVKVEYQVGGTWVTLGTFNFGGSGSPTAIEFGDNGIDNVQAVRFTVRSGSGGWASCAEMQFFKRGDFLNNITSLFSDKLCTKLKDGVTREQIEQIPTKEFREMALAMLDGSYSMEFRVGEFQAYMPLWQLRDQVLMTYYTYNNHENPTGITFQEGEVAVAIVEGVESDGIQLQVSNFGPTDFTTDRYALRNGINIIKISRKGNGYIDYYTTNWRKAPNVKIHFLNGVEQGYFSPKLKGHTNADWKRLLANAKGDCLDMVGEHIIVTFPVTAFKANCKNNGEWLMKTYDDMVDIEQELMGLRKYNYDFRNHMAAITVASSGGLYHASNDGFCIPVGAIKQPSSGDNPGNYDYWGAAHELGHVNQTKGFRWIGLTEVTNNLKSALVQHVQQSGAKGFHRLEDEASRFRYYRYLDKGVCQGKTWLPSVEGDVFATLVPFWQLLLYTRMTEFQPDAYPDLYEKVRSQKSEIDANSHGWQQVNFMRQWCHITKTNYLDFFAKVGMFKTIDQDIGDYSTARLTITQSMLNSLTKEIEKAGYEKAPEGLIFIDVYNYPIFRDKLPLEGNTIGKGCSKSGSNVRIQHAQWKNVVGFETYTADGQLLHITNFGRGEGATNGSYFPNYTNCEWNTAEKPAYIMAVGYDGTRIKCYEPK